MHFKSAEAWPLGGAVTTLCDHRVICQLSLLDVQKETQEETDHQGWLEIFH